MITAAVLSLCVIGTSEHEGYRKMPYHDRNGDISVGYGYNLTKNPLELSPRQIKIIHRQGVSKEKAEFFVSEMCNRLDTQLHETYSWYSQLPVTSQYVMLDMGYNMGLGGLGKFTKTIKLIENRRFTQASQEMLKSKWARQVYGRAIDLASILKSGHIA
jgi:lysozyme